MLIHHLGATTTSYAPRRAHAAPTTAAATRLDQVQLSGQTVQANPLNLAAQAVAAASQAAPAPAPARPGLEELRQMAERLQANGLKLEHRPKVLFWTLDFKSSNPDKFAKHAEAPGRVRVTHPDQPEAPMSLARADDMLVLDALYGKKDVSELSNPPLARALLALEEADPTSVRAYDEYLRENPSFDFGQARVRSGEQAIALAYFRGLVGSTEGLDQPEQATSLRALSQAGYQVRDGEFWNYANMSPYGGTYVEHDGQVLASFKPDELTRTNEVLAEVKTMTAIWETLRDRLGEHAGKALESVRSTSNLDLDTRVSLALRLFDGARYPETLMKAIDTHADEASQVDAWLRIGARYDATLPNGRALEKHLAALKSVTPKGDVPSESLQARFDALTPRLDPHEAATCAAAMERHPNQPAQPEKLLERLEGFCGRKVIDAFATLASHGRLAEDVDLLKSMVDAAGEPGHAVAAYPTLHTSVPPEHRELYLDLWKQAPGCAMDETWKAVFRPDADQRAARAAAWTDGLKSTKNTTGLSKLLSSLPDGPEFAWRADMLMRVVEGARGDTDKAAKVWTNFQASSDLETAARFYQATGRQESASRAAEILTRDDLGAEFSYEDRRNALTGLIRAARGDVDTGLSAYRHLLDVAGPDLKVASEGLSLLLATCGDEDKARVAFGAVRTSPPVPDSPTSATSLALALEVHGGDLGAARPLWAELETPDPRYSREERVANLEQTRGLDPEKRIELYRWMTSERLDATGREAVSQILAKSGDFKSKLAAVKLVAPKSPARKPMMEAMKNLGVSAAYLDLLVPHANERDFAELVEAAQRLSSRESVERLLASHTPGESYQTLGVVLSRTNGKFEEIRRSLGEGTPESDGLARNTEWFARQLNAQGDLARVEEVWDAVRRPVGAESTEDRMREFARLGASPAIWRALTSWMHPGETLSEAVDAARSLQAQLSNVMSDKGACEKLLSKVRTEQANGALESQTLAQVAARLEQALAGAGSEALLNDRKLTVEKVTESLTSMSSGAAIEEGAHHVVIGGVRMATRS